MARQETSKSGGGVIGSEDYNKFIVKFCDMLERIGGNLTGVDIPGMGDDNGSRCFIETAFERSVFEEAFDCKR